jgi:hypothetical protein
MKGPLVAVVAVALALALPAPVAAKEPIRATICGESGCATVTDKAMLREIPGGENTVALGAAAPYYRVTVVNGEPNGATHSFSSYYIPSANGMAWDEQGLVRLHPIYGDKATGVMRQLTADVEPFPAPRLTAAIVGDRRVTGAAAQTYLSLFSVREDGEAAAEPPTDWVGIDLRSRRGSPWTDARTDVVFAPGRNLIERGWTWVEVSDEVAADIEAGRALDARPKRARSWALGVAAAGVFALLGVLGARTGRRRMAAAP